VTGQLPGVGWVGSPRSALFLGPPHGSGNGSKYLFARTIDLERHAEDSACLKTVQRVPVSPRDPWKATLQEVLALFPGTKK
jgi:hypothetical protein